ncbi:L-amino acid N-acyltransferase YncA [Streptomyces sp. 3211.6]|uniref:GNAT family N-acetyltransferase n=1 Tax=Streptomyces TaxID=1883 RepID=UPI0009A49820|nr:MULTISPECIES: GNAT family N-acetyltransferase [Streptomyces]RKT08349.1 L-amino acid N-acyltransferase YncA [Streptomyces sp. 3211.6]RPF29750.1 L-amino acid N-acyltransferase YncA [Streptomyces sp. Ag109_G2-6]
MIRVRDMDAADIEAVAAIRVRGWQAAYAGLVPRSHLDAMTVEDDAARRREWFARPGRTSRDLVAADDRGPVGWLCYGRPEDGEPEGTGEVYALYAAPELIGTGIGRALLDEAHARMRAEGFTASALWVLDGNERALRFYERAGYRADGRSQDDAYDDGTVLTELRYRRGL